ncbi:hypothetical protein [Roseovarius sp. EL26]|uniref:hypothetical protein n=1 Tax=Roseovarius sp. EL26 TaxID=2126672 RepID=UPI000EA06631|nr:hypothetical protein [Roseovarius sp. EL26]
MELPISSQPHDPVERFVLKIMLNFVSLTVILYLVGQFNLVAASTFAFLISIILCMLFVLYRCCTGKKPAANRPNKAEPPK